MFYRFRTHTHCRVACWPMRSLVMQPAIGIHKISTCNHNIICDIILRRFRIWRLSLKSESAGTPIVSIIFLISHSPSMKVLQVPRVRHHFHPNPSRFIICSTIQQYTYTYMYIHIKSRVKLSRNRPWRSVRLWVVKDLTLSRQSAHRLTDGGKVVILTHPPHFTPQKHYYFYVSGTHFC
jgi:hypothetical protein